MLARGDYAKKQQMAIFAVRTCLSTAEITSLKGLDINEN